MNGALNPMPVGILDPRSQAIAQMGMALLASGGPSRTPVSFGANLGQAGMQGMQAFQQATQAQMQMEEQQRQAAERQRKQAALEALKSDPRFAGMEGVLDVAPNAAIQQVLAKPAAPKTHTDANGVLRYVDGPNMGQPVPGFETPKAPQDDDFTRTLKAVGIQPGTPQWVDAHRKRAEKLTSNTPLVQMPQQETAFQREVGQEMGKQYTSLMNADMNAQATIGKYRRLGNLLGNVNTGKFKGTITEMKAAAKAMGFDLTAMGVTDDVAPAQAARALSNQIALELRSPAGGAGMPGALSDQDREFLLQMVPSLENDPAAWPKMIEYRVKLAEREQQVAKMARAYRKKHGRFDEGFYDELADWSAKNPLFANEQLPAAPAPAAQGGEPNIDAILKKYER